MAKLARAVAMLQQQANTIANTQTNNRRPNQEHKAHGTAGAGHGNATAAQHHGKATAQADSTAEVESKKPTPAVIAGSAVTHGPEEGSAALGR